MITRKYLVDANVLCEPTKLNPNPNIVAWLRHHESELAVDPVIIGEVRYGIELQRGSARTQLDRWFTSGVQKIECLPWDHVTAVKWAELLARLRHSGKSMPVKETMVAATALTHGLALATRHRNLYERAGVKVVDPFDA